jgi:putative inorganic carbon (HCO3(-)) transporter
MKRSLLNTPTTLALMALALALFYRGGALAPALAGLLIFGALALSRLDLGLLFIPFTAPLYLIPASISGIRANSFLLPLHEAALVAVLAAAVVGWLWRRLTTDDRRPTTGERRPESVNTPLVSHLPALAIRYAPHLLFLLAGALGVFLAVERARALIEFRRLIIEPLIFYALFKSQAAGRRSQNREPRTTQRVPDQEPGNSQFSILNSQFMRVVMAFILGGAIVGLVGLLQFVGLDVAWLLGTKQCFAASGQPCDNVVVIGGLRRATSVYGHPNNLGLYLGRVWPLGAVLAAAPLLSLRKNQRPTTDQDVRPGMALLNRTDWLASTFFGLCALLCLGGIVVSFSRGAWFGAVAALAVLAIGMATDERARNIVPPRPTDDPRARGSSIGGRYIVPVRWYIVPVRWSLVVIAALVVVGGLALSLRGDITSGSTPARLLLWREAVGYILRYPLGIGLDQFGYYHDPNSGLSLIDPALLNSSEVYAAHPHNLILDTWLRVGPLGLIAFGWLLARFFHAGIRRAGTLARSPLALGALAAMTAVLAHGLVDNFYFVPDLAIAFWLLIALVEASDK